MKNKSSQIPLAQVQECYSIHFYSSAFFSVEIVATDKMWVRT